MIDHCSLKSGQWGQILTLRCASRNRNNPNNDNNNIGFRVVVSTFFHWDWCPCRNCRADDLFPDEV